MLFGYYTLFVALLIEVVGAYYSITGLAAIFSGAVVPILIMGGSLELGKVTAAVWLKNNWDRAGITYKIYLLPAVAMLMLITSMGIFGYLSKAHNDQTLVSGDVGSKLAIYDEKIKTAKDNIESDRKQLRQMDEAVDQVMARSTSENGADKAVSIRKSQQKDRSAIAKDIEANQKIVSQLNDEAAPIRAENRKVEAEVGPIKYIAKLIYEDNPDANILEKAVTWVIMIIVAVFDPLALVLILAAQQSIRWAHGEKPNPAEPSFADRLEGLRNRFKKKEEKNDNIDESQMYVSTLPQDEPVVDQVEVSEEYFRQPDIEHTADPEPNEELPFKQQRWGGFSWPMTSLFNKPKEEPVVEDSVVRQQEVVDTPVVEDVTIATVGDDYVEINGKRMHHKVFDPNSDHAAHAVERHIEKTQLASEPPSGDGNLWVSQDGSWVNAGPITQFDLGLTADNAPTATTGEMRGFGTSFPTNATKGDMFLRVDQLPSALYKFNGNLWIEVDKALTDQHAYDDAYIDHLIEKISTGEYDPELLSDAERSSIEKRLSNNPRKV
jgi:hypothetical protein